MRKYCIEKFNEVYESTNLVTAITDDMKKKNFQKLDVVSNLDLDNIFSSIAEKGWVHNEQVNNTEYLNQMMQNNNQYNQNNNNQNFF